MQAQLIKNSFKEYREMPGLNSSALKVFINNPKKYYQQFISKEIKEKEENRNFIFGRAVHSMVLEPHLFSHEFIVGDFRYTTKAGQANLELAKRTGKDIINDEEFELVNYFAQELPLHYEWYKYEAQAINVYCEITITIAVGGHILKVRIDKLFELEDRIIIFDVKSTSSDNEAGYQAAIADFDYLIQYAFYRFVTEYYFCKPAEFCFVFLSKKESRDIAFMYVDDPKYYEMGFKVVEAGIKRLTIAQQTNKWYANVAKRYSLDLKPWQLQKYTNYIENK